jgi:hypothetical protein
VFSSLLAISEGGKWQPLKRISGQPERLTDHFHVQEARSLPFCGRASRTNSPAKSEKKAPLHMSHSRLWTDRLGFQVEFGIRCNRNDGRKMDAAHMQTGD